MIFTYGTAGIMMRTATQLTLEQNLTQLLIQLNFYVMLCPSVCPYARISEVFTGRISVKYDTGRLLRKSVPKKKSNLVNMAKNYRALYMTEV